MRIGWLLLLCLTIPGCELVGEIFQAGLVVGAIVVLLLVVVIGWIVRTLRGRRRPSP